MWTGGECQWLMRRSESAIEPSEDSMDVWSEKAGQYGTILRNTIKRSLTVFPCRLEGEWCNESELFLSDGQEINGLMGRIRSISLD